MAQDTGVGGWGNAWFRVRRAAGVGVTSAADPQSRFVIGLIVFVVVALAYPWYSYWVQSRLFTNDVESGMRRSHELASAQGSGTFARRTRGLG